MQITTKYFLDKSEQDEQGFYDYYYEGYTYEIDFGNAIYCARSYTDEPKELSFQGKFLPGMKWHIFPKIPYEDERFFQCIKYFKELGFETFTINIHRSKGGYEKIQLEKFPKYKEFTKFIISFFIFVTFLGFCFLILNK